MSVKMRSKIDFDECLRDSPKFRIRLEEEETNIDHLEQKIEKVLKNCGQMVDFGKQYVAQQSLFANSLFELSQHFKEQPSTVSSLNKLTHALQEMNKFHTILLDQASRTVLKNLTSFIKSDIKSVKDSKHHFEKVSTELDSALLRNSQVSKNKPLEADEALNFLSAQRKCFRHSALDYVHSLTMLQARKGHEILATLLSFMHACCTYYHQGSDLCQDLDPFFKTLAEDIGAMRTETSKLEKKMEERHNVVTNLDTVQSKKDSEFVMEGYLFKRTSNAFKTWNRRWFYLCDNQLVYRKRTGEETGTVMEDDLRLCSIKPVIEGERRFCFEVLSPTKSHMLQADSEESLNAWISALQQAIGAALQRNHSHLQISNNAGVNNLNQNSAFSSISGNIISGNSDRSDSPHKRSRMWEQLLTIPGNNSCCDCGNPDPKWASINLGITLCIACSGVHRSLGVHYSKVRSLTLDDWEPEIVKVMAELGNNIVNRIYEANVSDITKATPNCQGNIREAWIKAKYVERRFVNLLPSCNNLTSNEMKDNPDNSMANDNKKSQITEVGVRKWSVRRLRRRPRSKENVLQAKPNNKVLSALTEAATDESSDDNETIKQTALLADPEMLLIGDDVPELKTPLELSSDQDSTGGESDGIAEEDDISNLNPNMLLFRAAGAHNLPVMCSALALGAEKTWANEECDNSTPLHQAVLSGSVMACEFLFLNGARLNQADAAGSTPLHLATRLGHTAQVCLLLKHRAKHDLKDTEGREPIDIAVNQANADIVTLLRLARLNEEIRATEHAPGDDTFNDVVRDFTQMAWNHPERLQRARANQD